MRSDARKVHYFHAEADSLGGFIEKPLQKVIPSQASSSLPAVGGHATHRTEAFNFEGIVSCRSAYTRVSGRHVEQDGPPSTIATSVVEGLNLLEVVTAERVVAQISIEHPTDGGLPLVSFTGSHFDGLKIGGRDASPVLNSSLLEGGPATGVARERVTWPLFQKTSRQQAAKLIESVKGDDRDAYQWVIDRYGWVAADPEPTAQGCVLCSLVDGVDSAIPGRSFGHVVHVPNFGRILFGEVLAFPASVHLSMIRAELGSATSGGMNVANTRVNGGTFPP
jgi:hypothetical protein